MLRKELLMKKAVKVLMVIAAVVAVLGVILQGVLSDVTIVAGTVASAFSVALFGVSLLVAGLILDSVKHEAVHKLGIGLHVAGVAMLATYAVAWFMSLPSVDAPLGFLECIIILAGCAIYGIAWFLVLLIHAGSFHRCEGQKAALDPEEDVHVAAIMKWKKLYNEGIITEREFIDKRNEILGLRK